VSAIVQFDSDKLKEVAALFGDQAEAIQQVTNELRAKMSQLQSGDWYGLGASVFYDFMDQEVFKGLQLLQEYLERSQDTANKIAGQIEEQAEYVLATARQYA
jgi:WXG100 family type VII secretion target